LPESKTKIRIALILWSLSAIVGASVIESVITDKARYSPGETVRFSVQFDEDIAGASLYISYYYMNDEVNSQTLTIDTHPFTWQWQPPQTDYRGYLTEIVLQNGVEKPDTVTIAIDLSSDWSKFPRYGFLSKYSYLSTSQIEGIIEKLNRYHINGLQFYDWHYKHHMPLKGKPENPASTWNDIANRINYFSTVTGFIEAAHARNMMALSYNLLYGAYEDAALDGVQNYWRLFRDQNHRQPDFHDLPSSWASDIYLIDPSNPEWVDYIIGQTQDALGVFAFDGWHIDQLGDRGTLYDHTGQNVFLPDTYYPFIHEVKNTLNTSLVINAVNQYGQSEIAESPVDFLYTEVWSPNDSYNTLVSIILQNNSWSNGNLATVLAAYVNKPQSTQPGLFNAPGVLLTDAVIFAAGGAHLELGEHMLANEYFPNDNLQMPGGLDEQLIGYYDFLVAYQNLLRDGGDFTQDYLQSEGDVSIRNTLRKGSIWSFSKMVENTQIFHMINFENATTLNWRDDDGDQPEPDMLRDIQVFFTASEEVNSLWLASPDIGGGVAQDLTFQQDGDMVWFTVPTLKYWNMVVANYGPVSRVENEKSALHPKFIFKGNYPNPFNQSTKLQFDLSNDVDVTLRIYDIRGREIDTLVDNNMPAGFNEVVWDGLNRYNNPILSGVYIVRIIAGENIAVSKMILMK